MSGFGQLTARTNFGSHIRLLINSASSGLLVRLVSQREKSECCRDEPASHICSQSACSTYLLLPVRVFRGVESLGGDGFVRAWCIRLVLDVEQAYKLVLFAVLALALAALLLGFCFLVHATLLTSFGVSGPGG